MTKTKPVVLAATKYRGKIYTGRDHGECAEQIIARFGDRDFEVEEGFTINGKYVERYDAYAQFKLLDSGDIGRRR